MAHLSSQNCNSPSSVEVLSRPGTREDLFALIESNPERYPFLLDSVATHETAQQSILLAFPQERFEQKSSDCDVAVWLENQRNQSPLEAESDLPFIGGWFVYYSYDYAQTVEPVLKVPNQTDNDLLACAVRVPFAIILNHETHTLQIICEKAYLGLMSLFEEDWAQLYASDLRNLPSIAQITEDEPQQFLDGVVKAKQYIKDGDVFQVNLSRGWSVEFEREVKPLQLYRHLSNANPAPFACLAHLTPEHSIISSSPERLVKIHNGWVDTRPIAGTRRRDADAQKDAALVDELINHPKERAEHIMLIDLERNDLGRISQPGTVEVNELMVIETYEHVHHIVSNVRGRLRSGITPEQVIKATFPGGTITGCPKVRCMQIIYELEQQPRGAYTGSLGYISRDGKMDTNILIRSFEQQGKAFKFRAGAGIVYDSMPEFELEETRHKAKGLLRTFSNAD